MTNKSTARIEAWFGKAGMISIGAVLFLILVGGIVRSTGAGMGCPDWPKCFGQWIPPTSAEELPANYQELYKDHGYGSAAFNVGKTWTEYVNRLIGVTVGIVIFAAALFSLTYFRKKRNITLLTVGALFLTGLQGWIGAKVVDTNLAGWMVTLHMLLALVIVLMLIAAVMIHRNAGVEQNTSNETIPSWIKWVSVSVILLTMVQILLGTQVRENVDRVAESLNFEQRENWIGMLGVWFSWHKLFYLALAASVVVWIRGVLTHIKENKQVRTLAIVLGTFLALEVLFGILLSQFALPAWLQPLHLLFASLIFSIECSILIWMFRFAKAPSTLEISLINPEYSLDGNS